MPRRPPSASHGPGDTQATTDHPLRHGLAASGVFVAAVLVAIGVPAVAVGVVAGESGRGDVADNPAVVTVAADVAGPADSSERRSSTEPPVVAPPSTRFDPTAASGWYGPSAAGNDRRPEAADPATVPSVVFGRQADRSQAQHPSAAHRSAPGGGPESTLPFDLVAPAAWTVDGTAAPTPAGTGDGHHDAAGRSPATPPPPAASTAPDPGPAEPAPGPTPTTAPPPAPTPAPVTVGPSAGQVAATLLSLVNSDRAAAGLAPLSFDGGLAGAATSQAGRMAAAGAVSHQDLATVAALGWSTAGENAGNGGDPVGLHRAFLASPGHRANILGAAFTHAGIGVVAAGDGTYWVAVVVAG